MPERSQEQLGQWGGGGCPLSACPQHPLEPCSWWDLETSPLQRLLPVFPEGLACTAGAGGSGDAETEVSCAQSYKDMAASRDWGQGVCECDGGSGGGEALDGDRDGGVKQGLRVEVLLGDPN